MDVSGSTSKDLKYEMDSASRFLNALLAEGNLEDSVALYDFAYDIAAALLHPLASTTSTAS